MTGNMGVESAGDSIRLVKGFSPTDVVFEGVLSENGIFSMTGELDAPFIAQIVKWRGRSRVGGDLIVESGNINVTLNEQGEMKASGTKMNDKYVEIVEYLNSADVKSQRELNALVVEKANENLDNLIGVYLFNIINHFGDQNYEEKVELFSSLTPQMQECEDGVSLKERIEESRPLEVGDMYIDFTRPNTKGEMVSASSLLGEGKWVLIDFWATWCTPCMREMPFLKEAYEEYHKYGFEICGLSTDSSLEKWREYCDANLPWVNLTVAGDVVQSHYKIQGLPTNFLISPEGKIVAKNLRGSDISEELAKWIKK